MSVTEPDPEQKSELPQVDFRDPAADPEARTRALLAALTVDEKLALSCGKGFWKTVPVPCWNASL